MPDTNLQQITETGKAPTTRIADVTSLNTVVQRLVQADFWSAINRQDVQAALDGSPPYDPNFLKDSGQEGRTNLNFQDLKRRVKREELGYYDLTDSVPTLGLINSEYKAQEDLVVRNRWNMAMSEEFHRMIKDWSSFDQYHQLLVHNFCAHGLGFLYFEDDLNWKWRVAGLQDFKVPRATTLSEQELDIAVVFRDVSGATLYKWCEMADENDKRWNKKEVYKAIIKAQSQQLIFSPGEWEKWQQLLKNNDIYVANTAQEHVKLAHCWIREYSGKVSQYLTLRNGGNEDFLFKCENRFDNINECFNFFPYEVGSNGTLHSVRGLAHERFPMAQVLNTLRCQGVDNARLAGSLLIQPKSATEAEDLALIYYGGVAYLPPEVNVVNGNLQNPSTGMLPIIQDMTFLLKDDAPNINKNSEAQSLEKTKFQVQKEAADEAVLPTTSLTLFYRPWKRHLNEVWRRIKNPSLKQSDPGGQEVFEFRKRCMLRGVPENVIMDPNTWIEPMKAIGYGSPGNRLLALDDAMKFYGSLDAVGQNNLLRDVFAQKVGYAQVDRFVPPIESTGRMPYDMEISELQNSVLSTGVPVSVNPNDNHIIHLQQHLPSLENDLTQIEQGQPTPQLLKSAVVKTQHCAQHMQRVVPDSLNKQVVGEIGKKFNNLAERTSAAVDRADRQQQMDAQKQHEQELEQAKQQGAAEAAPEVNKAAQDQQMHTQKMRQSAEAHAQKLALDQKAANQKMAIADATSAAKVANQS